MFIRTPVTSLNQKAWKRSTIRCTRQTWQLAIFGYSIISRNVWRRGERRISFTNRLSSIPVSEYRKGLKKCIERRELCVLVEGMSLEHFMQCFLQNSEVYRPYLLSRSVFPLYLLPFLFILLQFFLKQVVVMFYPIPIIKILSVCIFLYTFPHEVSLRRSVCAKLFYYYENVRSGKKIDRTNFFDPQTW